jgi:hypothetical protein
MPLRQRAWGKFLEHLPHALIQILDVLVRVSGEHAARAIPPEKLLRFRVEEIDNRTEQFAEIDALPFGGA